MKTLTKTILTLGLALGLFIGWGSMSAQSVPSNDDCANAETLTLGSAPVAGTTNGASLNTNTSASFCGAAITSPTVWYKVIGTGGSVRVSTCDYANFDTKISVYTGSCGTLNCVTGNDDGAGCSAFQSEAVFASVAGQTYYILVHGFAATTGNFNIAAEAMGGIVVNDTWNDASTMDWNNTNTGTTVGATPDAVPDCKGVASTAPGVWYTFTGDGSKIRLSTCTTSGANNFDSRLSLYTGTPGNFTCVEASDDYCGLKSDMVVQTTSNTNYSLLVHGFGSSAGDFQLSASVLTPPANDEPCNATAIAMGDTLPFDLTNATVDSNEVSPGPGAEPNTCQSQLGWCFFEPDVQNSVWYSFVAPASGCVNILADGFDTQLALWGASDCSDFSTYVEIAANDDSGPKLGGQVIQSAALIEAACLTPGATYYIQIDGFNGYEGSGTISVDDCMNLPLSVSIDNGQCQSAIAGYRDTLYITAAAAGGFAPYTYDWAPDSTIIYKSADGSGIAVVPTGNNTYTCTAIDDRGCTATTNTAVNVVDASCTFSAASGDFRTQTQGGWGTRCRGNNPGCYRDANFDATFPNGLTIGCASGYTMTFTSSAALEDFLPSGSTPRALDQNYTNPTGRGRNGYKNVFAGQVATLSLSVGFDANDPNFGASNATLGDLIITSGTFQGWTVSELLAEANNALGGCGSQYGISDLNNAVDQINNAFVDGSGTTSFLAVPGYTVCDNGVESCLTAADAQAAVANGATIGACSGTCTYVGPYFPPAPECQRLTIRTYGDVFSDFDNNWSLIDLTTGVVIYDNFPAPSLVVTQWDTCLDPTHCYELTINDFFGDGFGFGGWYEVVFLSDSIRSQLIPPVPGVPYPSESAQLGDCSSRNAAQDLTQDIQITAYPNPFRVNTNIDFRLPETANAKIEIFNLQGQLVETVFEGIAEANQPYTAIFNGSQLNQGIYFYRLSTDKGFTSEGKLVLQK